MILVTAAARLRPDTRGEALAAAKQMQETAAREPGCLDYRFWVAIEDPDSLFLFERWADQPSLDAHLATQHVRDFGASISAYTDGPVAVTRFEIADVGPLR